MKQLLTIHCQNLSTLNWSIPPKNLLQSYHQIHFWWIDITNYDKADIEVFESLLSKKEQQQAQRFRFAKDQKRYLITHGCKRQILAKYLFTAPQKLEFKKTKREKPFLIFPSSALLFNISHSAEKIAIAVWNRKKEAKRSFSLGIDVEQFDTKRAHDIIAQHFFSSFEQKMMAKSNMIEQFYTFWTRKEALLKASGIGLLGNIQELEVARDFWQTRINIKNKDWQAFANQLYQVFSFKLEKDYMGSISIGREHTNKNFELPKVLFFKMTR